MKYISWPISASPAHIHGWTKSLPQLLCGSVPNEPVQSEILGGQADYDLAQREQTPEQATRALAAIGLAALRLIRDSTLKS